MKGTVIVCYIINLRNNGYVGIASRQDIMHKNRIGKLALQDGFMCNMFTSLHDVNLLNQYHITRINAGGYIMSEIIITSENFEQEVLQSDKPVLVDFWATWCGPCQMIAPIVEEIARENADRLKVGKVNVDEQQRLAIQYGIESIPTLLVFKDGKETDRIIGYQTKEQLLGRLF